MSPLLSRSMILQAESKKEYEEVSLKKVNLFSLFIFISVVCAGTRTCDYRELSRLLCVFIFGRVLGNISHSQYQSASELTGALM